MTKPNSTPPNLLEHWKKYQCPDCRKGDRSKCEVSRTEARAFRQEPNGKTNYYCFVGCLMLDLDESARKKFIESQFNTEGHYETLARQ